MSKVDSQQWHDVVAKMRRDPREMGRQPGDEARFLQRFQGSMDALAAQHRREWGLNAHEMHAVVILWEFGRMTMTELGRRIPLSRAAVTTLTDRLELVGYVRRVPDPDDRRRIMLEVTDKVEQESARVMASWNARVREYVEKLDPETWGAVVDVLADLRDIAREEATTLREQAARSDKGSGVERIRGGERPKAPAASPTWW